MFMVTYWILAIIILYSLLKNEPIFSRNYSNAKEFKSALGILDEKFANEEIGSEEYERRKRKLK